MTDDEYRTFLDAVAKKHLRIDLEPFGGKEGLRGDIERLGRTYRLARVVGEREDELTLREVLGHDLQKKYARRVFDRIERTGVAEALDEHGDIIFAHLSREAIPDEDVAFLRQAGVPEPEAELVILVQHARRMGQLSEVRHASEILESAAKALEQAGDGLLERGAAAEKSYGLATLEQIAAPPRPKKFFNGIAKILSGAILGGGNILIAAGALVPSGGSVGASVIASCAGAVVAIGQGLGDLRGE